MTRTRSDKNSSGEYSPGMISSPFGCATRIFRVYLLFPPRHACGARSSTSTDAFLSRAAIAAHPQGRIASAGDDDVVRRHD